MLLRLAALPLLFTLLNHDASAMSWGELEKEILASESGKPVIDETMYRVVEIVQTVAVYTQALYQKNPRSPDLLFCIPKGTSMDINQGISLIRHQAKLENAKPDAQVQNLLLRALTLKFPCTAKVKNQEQHSLLIFPTNSDISL